MVTEAFQHFLASQQGISRGTKPHIISCILDLEFIFIFSASRKWTTPLLIVSSLLTRKSHDLVPSFFPASFSHHIVLVSRLCCPARSSSPHLSRRHCTLSYLCPFKNKCLTHPKPVQGDGNPTIQVLSDGGEKVQSCNNNVPLNILDTIYF